MFSSSEVVKEFLSCSASRFPGGSRGLSVRCTNASSVGKSLQLLDARCLRKDGSRPSPGKREVVRVSARRGADSFTGSQPRRMTIDDAVEGLAQPRLALTSTFLTWRQPPSR